MTIHEIPEEKEPTETKAIEKLPSKQLTLKNIVVGHHQPYNPEHASPEEVERNRRASKKEREQTALFKCGGPGGHKLA